MSNKCALSLPVCACPCRSPFIIQVEDTQRDLLDPALKGTRNVLAAAAKAKASVQRVVLTSSVAGQQPPLLYGQLGAHMTLRQRNFARLYNLQGDGFLLKEAFN